VGSWFQDKKHALVCPVGDYECLGNQLTHIAGNVEEANALAVRANKRLNEVHTKTKAEHIEKMHDLFQECGIHKT